MYKQQIQKEIRNLEIELGLKMESLVAQAPYIHLTPAHGERYDITADDIRKIEKELEINNIILERLEKYEMDYDDHLGTGMDTSESLTDNYDKTNE